MDLERIHKLLLSTIREDVEMGLILLRNTNFTDETKEVIWNNVDVKLIHKYYYDNADELFNADKGFNFLVDWELKWKDNGNTEN